MSVREMGVDSSGFVLVLVASRDLRGFPVAVVWGVSRDGNEERIRRDRCACSRRTGAGGAAGSCGAV
jgi:hypothetical protein